MKIEDFINAMGVLGIAYNKEFTQTQIATWYEYFKNTKLEVFKGAVKSVVSKSKFLPSIAELLEECKNTSKTNIEMILEKMNQDGYFKSPRELEKVYMWIEKGIIPSWLKEDMKKYFQSSKEILTKNMNLLEEK